MSYAAATQSIRDDFERKPEGLELIKEHSGAETDYEAMRLSVALVAANFAARGLFRPGQLAQDLSGWRSTLQSQCGARYRVLTSDPNGPQLSKKEANSDPELLTLQALKRGVGDAMKTRYRWAYDRSPKVLRARARRSIHRRTR